VAWLRSPARLAAAGFVLLAIVVGTILLVPAGNAYIILPDRARPVEPLVSIDGAEGPGARGGIYFVNVVVRKATLLERWVPAVREGADVVPEHAINPTGVSEAERRRGGLRDMSRSQRIAAAVALRELGYEVGVTEIGALVEGVVPGRPADGKLEPGDVIVSLDGERVRGPAELRDAVGGHRPGDSVSIGVRRASRRLSLELGLDQDPRDPTRGVIGVLIGQAASIRLPVRVKIESGAVGGPSAGLAFALDILEELGRDVDRGRRIAVTGALDLDGDVLPVGGVKQKTIGVREAGIDTFVVPAGENAAEARRNADGVRILAVRSFQQTLRALATASSAN
jgi:Lon-like protease